MARNDRVTVSEFIAVRDRIVRSIGDEAGLNRIGTRDAAERLMLDFTTDVREAADRIIEEREGWKRADDGKPVVIEARFPVLDETDDPPRRL